MKARKNAGKLFILLMTALAVSLLFSCKGLLLSKTSEPENVTKGILKINFFGDSLIARDAETSDVNTFSPEDYVDFFRVSLLSDSGEWLDGADVEIDGSFETELPAGTYCVIVQAMNDGDTVPENSVFAADDIKALYNMNAPLFIGRTNDIVIESEKTTEVTINMVVFPYIDDAKNGMSVRDYRFDWGMGKLPEMYKKGFSFSCWYTDNTTQQPVSDFPATDTADENFVFPYPSFTVSDTMDISVFTIQQRNQPPADNKIYKWIENKFGVTFKWDIHVGDKDQKIGVMIESGDLPDVVEVDSERLQAAGRLIDIKPLVEQYCPNLMSHYENVWKQMVYIDSEHDAEGNIIVEHLYSLPNYGVLSGADSGTYYNQNAFWIQKCVLKEFGYPVIKTVDQFFDLIEEYAKKYPTIDGMPTIPFHIMTYDWEAFNLWNTPNFLAGYPNDGNGHVTWDAAQGKYIYEDNFIDANAYRWFKLANGYYKRGLIDPESWTDNSDQWKSKLTQGRILGHFSQGWEWMGDIESHHQTAGMWERTYAPLPIVFDESITPHYKDETLPNLQRGYGFSVNSGEAKTIEILKFLDAMLKPENSKVLEWGIEGEDYYIDTDGSITGAAGRPYRTQEQREQQSNPEWQEHNKATLFREEAPKWEGSYPDGYFTSMDALPWEYELTQNSEDVELWKAYDVSSYAGLMTPVVLKNPGWYPMWQCNPTFENGGFEAEAAYAMTHFETIQRTMLPQAIMAETDEEFEAIWADFCEQMKPHTEIYNKFMQEQLDIRIKFFGGDSN